MSTCQVRTFSFCSKHVLTEDVVERKVVNKKLYSKRLLTKTNSIPKWGERLLRGPKYVTILEESIVDPVRKHVTTYTRNIGMKSIMVSLWSGSDLYWPPCLTL